MRFNILTTNNLYNIIIMNNIVIIIVILFNFYTYFEVFIQIPNKIKYIGPCGAVESALVPPGT